MATKKTRVCPLCERKTNADICFGKDTELEHDGLVLVKFVPEHKPAKTKKVA